MHGSQEPLETDYLVVGAGAVGMAFADTLLTELERTGADGDIVLVDRHPQPGGHWNDAYPFVTLHQPSTFYGVPSLELSRGLTDETGWNQGLGDLATGAEIMAYFDQVMRHRLLPSGRVRHLPMSDYDTDDGSVTSLLSGTRRAVTVRRRVVDTTYLRTSVPSTHTPSFTVADGVRFIPLNDLPRVSRAPEGFVVIGGGKTGIDACLWLLSHDVDPDRITWIMPRDAWLLDRRNTQTDPAFFHDTMGAQAAQLEAIRDAESMPDLFDRLEGAGVLLRLDDDVRPTMFHGATVSRAELEQLRRIRSVVRMGRVSALESDRIVLADGEIPTSPDVVHVDCSASAIAVRPSVPIFSDGLITCQTVRSYQPVFSAALVAHVEATRGTDEERNELCQVVPLPNHDTDWARMMIPYMLNQYHWGQDEQLRAWLAGCRLDGFSAMTRGVRTDPDKMAVMTRLRAASMPAMGRLHELVAGLPG